MMKVKTSTLDLMKKTRNLWERNPVTRVHDHDPKRNRKKERQGVKQYLRKAHIQDDGAFLFGKVRQVSPEWRHIINQMKNG